MNSQHHAMKEKDELEQPRQGGREPKNLVPTLLPYDIHGTSFAAGSI